MCRDLNQWPLRNSGVIRRDAGTRVTPNTARKADAALFSFSECYTVNDVVLHVVSRCAVIVRIAEFTQPYVLLSDIAESLGQLSARCPAEAPDSSGLLSSPDTAQQFMEEQAQKRQLQEQRCRRQEIREKVIDELLQTENDYLQSLCLCLQVFFGSASRKVICRLAVLIVHGSHFFTRAQPTPGYPSGLTLYT
jgi:hypothetical protein